jgi:hypothetical protein
MSGALSSYEYKKKYSYFSGKKKDWIPWEEKYLAKSRRYGYKDQELPGLRNMRTLGEIAIVNHQAKRKMRGKLDDRGRPCILLGRAKNHHQDVYRFLNLETKGITRCCDALWLNKQYGVWKGVTKQNITNIDDDDDDEPFLDLSRERSPNIETGRDTESPNIENGRESADINQIEVVDANDNPVPPKLASAMRKVGGFFDHEPQTITNRFRATRQLARKPTEDPITQSGREDTIKSATSVMEQKTNPPSEYDSPVMRPSISPRRWMVLSTFLSSRTPTPAPPSFRSDLLTDVKAASISSLRIL